MSPTPATARARWEASERAARAAAPAHYRATDAAATRALCAYLGTLTMDPTASLALVNDPEAHPSDRLSALIGLRDWHVQGGAMPCGPAGGPMHPTLTDEAVETLAAEAREEGWDPGLPGDVRAALAYGEPLH